MGKMSKSSSGRKNIFVLNKMLEIEEEMSYYCTNAFYDETILKGEQFHGFVIEANLLAKYLDFPQIRSEFKAIQSKIS